MQLRFFIATLSAGIFVSNTPFAYAADSAQNASGASTHASKAMTMGIAASGQATLGVLAIPMLSIGAVGNVVGTGSTAVGKASSAAAGGLSANGSLPIADETITVFSPTEALNGRTTNTPR